MTYLDQFDAKRRRSRVCWLEDSDLKGAARCILGAWLVRFERSESASELGLDPREFGMLEPYLAEAIVLDHGSDFLFARWGSALGALCGGDRDGERLSAFPQPSRSHLRRVCVRAAVSRVPTVSRATWALDSVIWRCSIMALPTSGDAVSVGRILVALLFAPDSRFENDDLSSGRGWPPAIPRGAVHELARPRRTAPTVQPSGLRVAAYALRRLLTGHASR